MKKLLPGKTGFRLSAGFILAVVLFFSCNSDTGLPGDSVSENGVKSRPLLLMTDVSDELVSLRAKLTENGWKVFHLTQEGFLTSVEYLDLSEYGSVVACIHKPLHEVVEEALIGYAETGGKLLILHHSLASAKVENPEWLKFLGVSILPRDKKYPWKVSAETSHIMVNLAPGHYITSHKVKYDREVDFSFVERPDLEGTYPAFQLDNTEVFHNQRLAKNNERVILFGYRMKDAETGNVPGQPVIPRMEPTSGWYKPAGKGWVFYLQPGHTELDFENQSFFQVMLNCLNWEPNNPVFASSSCLLNSPEFVTVDLNLHEIRLVTLPDGNTVKIRVESMKHHHDPYRKAVRGAEVRVHVNDEEIVVGSGMYNLPREVSGIQIDCPVTSAWVHHRDGSLFNPWSLESDVRLRIWPGETPWIDPDTFVYPVDAGWFSSDTQMSNDP
ncbi:MAG: ThuA domain-containing protein, partial [Acidobacteriota bacterium]